MPVAPHLVRHAACPTTWKHRVLAAVLAADEGAAASHMTAAALWRCDGVGAGAVEVTVPNGRRPRGVPGTLHRTVDLPRAHVVRREPVVLTTPSRTLLDIAPWLEPRRLEEVLDGAERDGTIWRPLWDGALLVAELAGHSTHSTRRQRQGDAERAARLGLTGWRVVQFTYEDVVERPQHVVDVVRAYLAQA